MDSTGKVAICTMACVGSGVWLALSNSPTVRLYHTETRQFLQEVSVDSTIRRLGMLCCYIMDRQTDLFHSLINTITCLKRYTVTSRDTKSTNIMLSISSRHTDGQTDRQVDGWLDRQTNRQTD